MRKLIILIISILVAAVGMLGVCCVCVFVFEYFNFYMKGNYVSVIVIASGFGFGGLCYNFLADKFKEGIRKEEEKRKQNMIDYYKNSEMKNIPEDLKKKMQE